MLPGALIPKAQVWVAPGISISVKLPPLYMVDSQSRAIHEVLSASPNTFESLSVSRDDRLVVYTIRVTEADIWLACQER
jgi:hypothetical protein